MATTWNNHYNRKRQRILSDASSISNNNSMLSPNMSQSNSNSNLHLDNNYTPLNNGGYHNNTELGSSNNTRTDFIPKRQHYNTEVINLDSDDEDYIFNPNNANTLDYCDDFDGNGDEDDDEDDENIHIDNYSDFLMIQNHLSKPTAIRIDDEDDEENNNTTDVGRDDGFNSAYNQHSDNEEKDTNVFSDYYNNTNLDHTANGFSNRMDISEDYVNPPLSYQVSSDNSANTGNNGQNSLSNRHASLASPINGFFNKIFKKTSNSIPSLPNNRSASKFRTKSMPQLSYSKMTYSPALDSREVDMKIGDVKANLINHNQLNYTYKNKKLTHQSIGNFPLRKLSFNHTSSNENSKSSSAHDDVSNQNRKHVNIHVKNLIQEEMGYDTDENSDGNCDDNDGYYIIKINAPFANGRFIIKKLLGQGTFGKVVKAYDNKCKEYVAIKIIKSIQKYREASKIELRVLTMLKKHDPTNRFQLIHLRECFDYRNHICIVTNLLKFSLYDFMEKNQFLPFPGSHIQAISKQLLRSVAFLHDLKLIHTDLKPENILIQDDTYFKKPYVRIADNKKFSRKVLKDPKIYTIDFGSAIFENEYHSSVISTRHYRAPEIILGIGWSFPCDVWSIGTILLELLTGEAVFKTHRNDQHLAMMEKVINEPIDPELVHQCLKLYGNKKISSSSRFDPTIANEFAKSDSRLLFLEKCKDERLINDVKQLLTIEQIVETKIGFKFDMSLSCNASFNCFNYDSESIYDYTFWYYYIDLIRKMLIFDPKKRISAKAALNHKWFEVGILDDGILNS